MIGREYKNNELQAVEEKVFEARLALAACASFRDFVKQSVREGYWNDLGVRWSDGHEDVPENFYLVTVLGPVLLTSSFVYIDQELHGVWTVEKITERPGRAAEYVAIHTFILNSKAELAFYPGGRFLGTVDRGSPHSPASMRGIGQTILAALFNQVPA